MIIREALYRLNSTMVILLTVVVATSVSVAVFSLSKASEDETRKIMREQGLNLFMFPKGTETMDFFSYDYSRTFDESYVDILARARTFDAVRHLVGVLQVRYPDWVDPNGSKHKIFLVGYKDEAVQINLRPQESMGYDVESGTVKLGSEISVNVPEGKPFVIEGEDGRTYEFEVAERLKEGRGILDQSVAMNLQDLQKITGMEGKINKIEALGCTCHGGRVDEVRRQVTELLPGIEVKELASIANAREEQRQMMNRYGSFIIPFVILASLIITGFLFYENVKARRHEVGILRALGSGNWRIVYLVLGKAFLLGVAGAVAGFFLGSLMADIFGRQIFRFTAENIHFRWGLLYMSMIVSPILWMLASWIPSLYAIFLDPARILSQE